MELLITLIGNAAVDPDFRERWLNDPLKIAHEYGFRLTKGEVELMNMIFTPDLKNELNKSFETLQNSLYKNLITQKVCPKPPCRLSLFPPRSYTAPAKAA